MAFCDKDRLLRFAAGLKTKFMKKSDYDPKNAVSGAGGIPDYIEAQIAPMTANLNKIKAVKVTLTTAGWSSSAPYTQTVTVNGMTADWKPVHMTIPKTSTSVDTTTVLNELGALSCIQMCTSAAGKLTFTALETKPSVALTIEVHGGI